VVVAQALENVDVDVRILWGHCDPLPTPRPLGPFRESELVSFDSAAAAGAVRVSDLCDRVRVELSTQPTVLVIEDLHWLDEVSGELLRFLARRIESMPLALIVTYRDVEIGPRHPARPLLGDFASLDGLQTLKLRPLSVDAIQELVSGTSLDPGRVHAVTGGNPFFVTAVAREPDLPMPGSVRDAVLARVAEIAPEDLEVLQLVATAPDGLDDRALPALAVGLPTLRRLDETALLTRTRSGVAFRHELARLALLSTIPPGGSAVFHTRLLDVLERLEPRDPAVLTHHAVGARDARRSVLHARAAAAEAVASSSNIEAAAFLEIALANLPTTAPPAERARAGHPARPSAVPDRPASDGDHERTRVHRAVGSRRRPRRRGRGARCAVDSRVRERQPPELRSSCEDGVRDRRPVRRPGYDRPGLRRRGDGGGDQQSP
jgi:hypothetical protein